MHHSEIAVERQKRLIADAIAIKDKYRYSALKPKVRVAVCEERMKRI